MGLEAVSTLTSGLSMRGLRVADVSDCTSAPSQRFWDWSGFTSILALPCRKDPATLLRQAIKPKSVSMPQGLMIEC
jgi:hypothetical protein